MAPATSPADVSADAPARAPGRSLDLHIQGLRGVAVALVVAYHCQIAGFRGGAFGVDVFFVISGYIITRSLVAEWQQTGTIRLWDFFARRIRRLLPVSCFVLLVLFFALTVLWVPSFRSELRGQAQAATVAGANVWSALHAVDYAGPDARSSPFTHLWSLAIEEQFYLLAAPAALLMLRSRWARRRGPRAALPLVACVLVGSYLLDFSYVHEAKPWLAFYLLEARAWELLVGVALALVPSIIGRRGLASELLGWAGLAAIGYAATSVFTVGGFSTRGPLIAVAGTAAVIVSGAGSHRWSVGRLLAIRPLVALGAIAYPLYLWHWVVLSLLFTRDHHYAHLAALTIAVSLPIAVFTHVAIERRLRWLPGLVRRPRATVVGGIAVSLVMFGLASVVTRPHPLGIRPAAADGSNHYLPTDLTPTLASTLAGGDEALPPCVGLRLPGGDLTCGLGDPAGTTTVLAVGDSHMRTLLWGLDAAARRAHWRVYYRFESKCSWIDLPGVDRVVGDRQCPRTRASQAALARQLHPDLVVATAFDARETAHTSAANVRSAMARTIARYPKGTRFLVLADVPSFYDQWQSCLAAHQQDTRPCGRPLGRVLARSARHKIRAAARANGVAWGDTAPLVCPDRRCLLVRGRVLVYHDDDHLSTAFTATLGPQIQGLIGSALQP